MAAGSGLTVTSRVRWQPVPSEYVIVAVPVDMPVTTPVLASAVSITVLLLLHVPPLMVLPSAIVAPRHTLVAPLIADGVGVTVSTAVAVLPSSV